VRRTGKISRLWTDQPILAWPLMAVRSRRLTVNMQAGAYLGGKN